MRPNLVDNIIFCMPFESLPFFASFQLRRGTRRVRRLKRASAFKRRAFLTKGLFIFHEVAS
jgi:hypothetical protein